MAKLDPSRREAKSLARSQGFHVSKQSSAMGIDSRARRLVEHVCRLAGRPTLISDLQQSLEAEGVVAALDQHDTPLLYNWMVRGLAYQGISDYVAHEFMERHGAVTWSEVENSLSAKPSCSKLRSYWHFHRCGYSKTTETCNAPSRISACPLPLHPLRNGRLNQSAYSLYLFIRDLADCDLVGWLESTINVTRGSARDLSHVRDSLSESLQGLFGVSNKMLNMIVSDLLIGGGAQRPHWLEIGAGMIVVDTLVHNFLWRTGILRRHNAEHAYGPNCYRVNGCADIIRGISVGIDAQQFNSTFPRDFPRFVQHAIWRYCAQQGLDICNGNRINDRRRCVNGWCPVFEKCERALLPRPVKVTINTGKSRV